MSIRKGTLKSFDNINKKATIQMDGSLALFLKEVSVTRELTGTEMVAGRTVAVAFFDDANPEDAMVLGVF